MTAAEIREMVKATGFTIGGDSIFSMGGLCVDDEDVRSALYGAVSVASDGRGFIVTGPALDGQLFGVIVTISDRVHVIDVC